MVLRSPSAFAASLASPDRGRAGDSRRQVCGWLLAGLAAALTPALTSHRAHADPVRRIGIFGDSLGDGVWIGMNDVRARHPGDTPFRYSQVGAGLTRRDFTQWIAGLPLFLDADEINAAVVMVGANDLQSLRDDNHKGFNFGTPGWTAVYRDRIAKLLTVLKQHKVPVVWLGLPILRNADSDKNVQLLNEIFTDAVVGDNVRYLPLYDTFKGADGGFAVSLPDAQGREYQIRTEDGIHFTNRGYAQIAEMVYAAFNAPPGIVGADATKR